MWVRRVARPAASPPRRRRAPPTARAVGVLDADHGHRAGRAVGGVIENLRRAEQLGAPAFARARAGTMPRWTSVTSSRVRCSAGNAAFASAMKASTSRGRHARCRRLPANASDCAVPIRARPVPRHERQHPSVAARAPPARCRSPASTSRGSSPAAAGRRASTPNTCMTSPARAPAALIVSARADVDLGAGRARRARACRRLRRRSRSGATASRVVDEPSAARVRAFGKRDRQAVRPGRSGSRTTWRRRSGRPGERRETASASRRATSSRGGGSCSSGSTPSLRCRPSHRSIRKAARSASRFFSHGSVGADDEGQRAEQARRDARERAPLADRLARAIDPAGLQRPQAAVRGR